MPYFYKLADIFPDRNLWMEEVGYVFYDFCVGCKQRHGSYNMDFLLFMLTEQEVYRSNPLNYEYRSINGGAIPREKIFDCQLHLNYVFDKYSVDEEKQRLTSYAGNKFSDYIYKIDSTLKDAGDRNTFSSLYVHITCEKNIESIKTNGLYADDAVLDKYEIGDRENMLQDVLEGQSDSEHESEDGPDNPTQPRHYNKYLKYKKKYTSLKLQLKR